MSFSPREIEEIIAKKFGELSEEGEPFTVESLENFLAKFGFSIGKSIRENKREELQAVAAPRFVCPNRHCSNTDEGYFEQWAQMTCMKCGTVLTEWQIRDGKRVRILEDKVKEGSRIAGKDIRKDSVLDKMQEISESIQLNGSIVDRAQLIGGGETSVQQSSALAQMDTELAFQCKYCDFAFCLKRDKIFHQKKCDQRPTIVQNGGSSTSLNGEQTDGAFSHEQI